MRLAVCGKGGVGKTALTAMLARVLAGGGPPASTLGGTARSGDTAGVLAFDFDVNPGLERSVGPLDRDPRLPAGAVAAREGAQYGYALRDDLDPTAAALAYAATGPHGLRVLSLGRITTAAHDLATTHYALRQIAAGFDADGWDVVVDMEAGPKDVFDRSYVAWVDLLVLVTDASPVADLACRRLASIARAQDGPAVALVLNRATPARRHRAARVARELGVPLVGEVADDEGVRLADVAGAAVADHAPATPALAAVRELGHALRRQAGAARDAATSADATTPETTGG